MSVAPDPAWNILVGAKTSMKPSLVLLDAMIVSLCLFVGVRATCHECLTFPSIAVCERRSGAIDVELH